MLGELVTTMTSDRVRLDGFFCDPKSQAADYPFQTTENLPIDGAVVIHGLSGNFYKSRLLKHFASQTLSRGLPTVMANTRGHDYLNSTARMGRAQTLGSAVEDVSESQFDLHAWAEFLADKGCKKVLLLGHSLGAIKSLYAQAHNPNPAVAALACLSATRLSEPALLASEKGDSFRELLNKARNLVDDQKGDELLFVDFPFPTWMSAAAYARKYGSGDSLNWVRYANAINVPTLCVFGQIEMAENPAFMGMQHDLDEITAALENFRVEIIESADHFYSARALAASEKIMEWLMSVD